MYTALKALKALKEVEEMASNWKKNELHAAARLGLSAVSTQADHGKVHALDVELDDGGRVVLTVLRGGAVTVQTLRASMSAKSLYRVQGTVTLDPGFIREWAETLFLVTQGDPRRGHEVVHRGGIGSGCRILR